MRSLTLGANGLRMVDKFVGDLSSASDQIERTTMSPCSAMSVS